MSQKRINWVDTAKGIAILLVIFGHMPADDFVHDFIYSFHMPLFFIISGFFIAREASMTIPKHLKKKFDRLLIPYLFFGLVIMTPFGLIFESARSGTFSLDVVADHFVKRVIGLLFGLRGDWPCIGVFWFLPCLFCSLVLIHLVSRLTGRYSLVAIIIFSITGFIYNGFIGHSLPFSIDLAMIAALFIMVGSYVYMHSQKISWSVALLCGAVGLLASVINGRVEMYDGRFNNPIYFLLSGIGLSIALLKICMSMRRLSIIEWLGMNTLLIYMLHFLFQPFVGYLIIRLPYNDLWIINLIYCIGGVGLICLLLYPVVTIINRKLPFPLGQAASSKGKSLDTLKRNVSPNKKE